MWMAVVERDEGEGGSRLLLFVFPLCSFLKSISCWHFVMPGTVLRCMNECVIGMDVLQEWVDVQQGDCVARMVCCRKDSVA